MMASHEIAKSDYAAKAVEYQAFYDKQSLMSRIDEDLFGAAVSDPTTQGAVILDLGGGAGLKARMALDAGAAAVDVVDYSPEMMREGQEIEKGLGRDSIRWFEADVSQPLSHLPLHPQYDILMANWVFDHASSMEMLEGMFRNVASYLRPGGRLLCTRAGNPRAPCLLTGELGVVYKDHEEIPGGLRYRFVFTALGIDFEGSSMEVMYSGSTEMFEKHGLIDIKNEPFENAEVVKENPELFKSFFEDPAFVILKATKRQ
ncbi:S-adenosyl-L-methionine-dependent methyltransferase [Xylariaceae sp. FL0594]|nr:S-adenosyl-L-methionine-dependent methyltransferase [Xylariaceae sp. FL0594]